MSNRPIRLLIDDMLDAIGRIEEYTKEISYKIFVDDQKTIDAVVRNLEIIGEAANRLPEEFKEKHSEIEWYKIVGLRHRIVHKYFGIDINLIWQILKNDLPVLRQDLSQI